MPTIERRMTFHPRKYDPAHPWPLPADTADVFYKTTDGVRLHGWFTTGLAPRTGLTVLYFHGNGNTVRDVSNDADLLHSRGFDVLLAEYRGFGRSEGDTLNEQTTTRDGEAALAYLTRERGIDPASIVLIGYSFGTTVAARLAATNPCHALLLMAPLASARRQAEGMKLFSWLPDFFFEHMANKLDTVGTIASARCPVMVVHGDDDHMIGVDQGRAVYAAARPPKRLIIVPGADHWLTLSMPQFTNEVTDFLTTPR